MVGMDATDDVAAAGFDDGGASGVCSPVVLVYPIVPWDQRSPSLSKTAGVGGLV